MGAAIAIMVMTFVLMGYNIANINRVETRITAYAQPAPSTGKQFLLQGSDPRYVGGDPSWPVYARILSRALEAKGFVAVASNPDLIIKVSYRLGDSITSVSTTSTPTSKGGSTDSTSVSTTNLRTIQIEALAAASVAAGKPTVVWSIRAQSRGPEDGFAKVFPVMVAAMEDYVGVTAEQEVKVSKFPSDPEVVHLTQP